MNEMIADWKSASELCSQVSRRGILSAMCVAALGGCATTTIEAPDRWPMAQIVNADVMPSQEALSPERLNRRTRVVVMEPAESPAARGHGLPEQASAVLEAVLGKGSVEVVDRRTATRLDQEIRLIETRGGGAGYSGPEVADYAITVVMGTASYSINAYSEASTYVDKKTGKTVVVTPAGFTHSGRSVMTLRIYELPSLRMVTSIPIDASVSTTPQRDRAGAAQASSMMRAATERGIEGKRAEVLNEFAPRGYISERREKDKKSIFRALISKHTGAKQGDAVEIFTLKASKDGLTGRVATDQTLVAKGRVSNVVGDESSWVIVGDEKEAAQVRRGDIVRVRHSNSMFGL
jgi:hypothetical protein